jgi:hypothetical protein
MRDEHDARMAKMGRTGGIARLRRPLRRGRRLALLTVLACAALAVAAAGAQAVIVTVGGSRLSLEPLPGAAAKGGGAAPALRAAGAKPMAKKPLVYHNGPVMPSNTNYVIYWDPSGGSAFPAGYQAGINGWFEDLAHDSGGVQNTDSVLTQYGDEFGNFANYDSHFAGSFVDTDPYPASGCSAAAKCLSGAQIRNETIAFVAAHSLPTDLEHMYFLLTPKEVESCTDTKEKVCSAGTGQPHAAYCAYHEYIELPKGGIVFANVPYIGGLGCGDESNRPNGSVTDEELAGGLVHEHSEAVTDPTLHAWYDEQGNEVGDKCRVFAQEDEYGTPLGKAPNGSFYNQVVDGDLYWYQQEWSNEAAVCSQRKLALPTIKKMKPKNGPEAGGTAVVITGTGFTPSATVRFGEAPATEVKYTSSTSITAVSPAHVLGTVEVTVTTGGGTSALTKKDRFKYKKAKAPKAPR